MNATLTLAEAVSRAWDVIVVGAGPAGAMAAREIARIGCTVLLVDKATFPRGKVCGCCLNGLALSTLASVGLESLVQQCGAVPLHHVQLGAAGRTATVHLADGVALSREALDVALIREAVASGAVFLPGMYAKFLDHQQIGLQSVDHRDEPIVPISARVHVVADGLNGQLRPDPQQRSEVAPGSRIGAGVMVPVAPGDYEPGTIYMASDRGGYVGLVRVEKGRLDIAAAFDAEFVRQAGGLGHAAKTVLQRCGFPTIPDLETLPWRGTPALTRTSLHIAGPNWFAIGDAAGYIEPFTGEGMAWALTSGAMVAPVVARSVAGWSPALATEWESTHARVVRSRQTICRVVAQVLRSPLLCRIVVTGLRIAPVLSRPIVRALNRPTRQV